MNPLLSIIVPTKDRYEYLKPLIELVKSFNSDEIELVVQDNTKDNSEIIQFIDECNYSNLKYFHTADQLSVARNSDLAILNSKGRYVCFIGDDDGVSYHIISAVKWMEEKRIDVLKSTATSYKWPSFNFSKIGNFSAVLMLGFYDKKYKKVDAIAELKKCLLTGGNEVALLPKVYHGIAKRSTLDKIYVIGETYFPGPSPDMANSVAMSFVAENYVYLNFPVIIPGNSIRAGGDAQKFKRQCAQISEVPFLPKDTEKNWENFIPKVWASETIMPESACKSLKYMDKADYIEKYLNKEQLLAFFMVGHPDLKHLAIQKSNSRYLMYFHLFIFMLKKIFKAGYNKIIFTLFGVLYSGVSYSGGIFNVKNYFKIIKNIQTINEANEYIMKKERTFKIK
ncbi:glycosyltransferase family 2 protein [Chryseobacterium sp. 2TAF14]|uniref:glycosyltransferase family 2 protein n=1 Tax=Chryseobacterium sp. 2TAF14 TaxID=3233007 RepID=UPI003F93589C